MGGNRKIDMKKVSMDLFKEKKREGEYSTLVLYFGTKESEQEIKKLILITQNALKSKFAGVQLVERRSLREFLQRDP